MLQLIETYCPQLSLVCTNRLQTTAAVQNHTTDQCITIFYCWCKRKTKVFLLDAFIFAAVRVENIFLKQYIDVPVYVVAFDRYGRRNLCGCLIRRHAAMCCVVCRKKTPKKLPHRHVCAHWPTCCAGLVTYIVFMGQFGFKQSQVLIYSMCN